MKKCSICKQQKEIVFKGEDSKYCECCWSVVNAPYQLLLDSGRKVSKK